MSKQSRAQFWFSLALIKGVVIGVVSLLVVKPLEGLCVGAAVMLIVLVIGGVLCNAQDSGVG